MNFFAPRLEETLRKNFPGFFSEIAPASDEADVLIRLVAYCRDTGIRATQEELGTYAITFYAVNLWRKYRTIYRLDQTVGEMLIQQASESDLGSGLPADLLLNLPLPCISIEAPPFSSVYHDKATGEVLNEYKFSGNLLAYVADGVLHVISEHQGGSMMHNCLTIIPGGTIGDCIADAVEHIRPQLPTIHTQQAIYYSLPVFVAMQVILYLAAANSDKVPRRSTRKPGVKKPPRVIEVGYVTGSSIRARSASSEPVSRSHSSHASPVPHVRGGHWHHFWTGPRDDPGKRKLVLRWVAPTFVGGKLDKPIVHNVLPPRKELPS